MKLVFLVIKKLAVILIHVIGAAALIGLSERAVSPAFSWSQMCSQMVMVVIATAVPMLMAIWLLGGTLRAHHALFHAVRASMPAVCWWMICSRSGYSNVAVAGMIFPVVLMILNSPDLFVLGYRKPSTPPQSATSATAGTEQPVAS